MRIVARQMRSHSAWRIAVAATAAAWLPACGATKESKDVRAGGASSVGAVASTNDATGKTAGGGNSPGEGNSPGGGAGTDGKRKDSSAQSASLGLTWDDGVGAIISSKCAPCHAETPTGGAPATFQLSAFGLDHGKPGAGTKIEAIRRVLNENSMPPAGPLPDDQLDKVQHWLDVGAPENQTALAAAGGERGIALAEAPALSGNKVTIKVRAIGGPGATWTASYAKSQGATSGGTRIMDKIPLATSTIEWDTSKVLPGLYYVYVRLFDGDDIRTEAAADPVKIGDFQDGTDPNVVVFRIPAGTGNAAWNAKGAMVDVKVGQTLRIFNDDTVAHRMHTGGAPCGHQPEMTPPGGAFDCIVSRPVDPSGADQPPTYDHGFGRNAMFWVRSSMP
jgi:hypothetical protein